MTVGWERARDVVLDRLVTACVVVTAADADLVHGCLVASVMPVGVGDPLVALALGEDSLTERLVRRSGALALHSIGADRQDLAELFGRAGSAPGERLDAVSWHRGSTGAPVVDGCAAHVEARVVSAHTVRGNVLYVVEPVAAAAVPEPAPPYTVALARGSGLESSRAETGEP